MWTVETLTLFNSPIDQLKSDPPNCNLTNFSDNPFVVME